MVHHFRRFRTGLLGRFAVLLLVLAAAALTPAQADFHFGENLTFEPEDFLLNATTTAQLRIRNTGVAGYFAAEIVTAPSGWTVTPTKTQPIIVENNKIGKFNFQVTTPEFTSFDDREITIRLYAYESDIIEKQVDLDTYLIRALVPPEDFQLLSPINGAEGYELPITFSWGTATWAETYRVEFFEDNFGLPAATPFYTAEGVTGTTFELNNSIVIGGENLRLPPGAAIHWKVTAVNPVGETENLGGATYFFTKPRDPVGAFSYITPAPGVTLLQPAPSFEWTAAENSVLYVFQLYPDSNGSPVEPAIVEEYLYGVTQFDWGTRPHLDAGNYHVVVTAFNENSGRTIDGGVRAFTTTNLTSFTLTEPAAAAVGVAEAPFFRWSRASGAQQYQLDVVLQSGDIYIPVLSTIIPDAGTSYQWTGTPLRAGARYWWQVTALRSAERRLNDDGPRYFDVVPLRAFSALLPEAGQTGVPRQPVFEWHASEGAASYVVEVAPSNDGVPDTGNLRVSGNLAATPTRWAATFNELEPGKTYFWRVRASEPVTSSEMINREGWQAFTTNPLVPFTLVAPANGATGVSRTPTFQWNPISGALRYQVHVTAEGLGTLPPLETTLNIGSLAVPEDRALNGDTDFTWTVEAIGPDGTQLASETFAFRTAANNQADAADVLDALLGRQVLSSAERTAAGLGSDEVISIGTILPVTN